MWTNANDLQTDAFARSRVRAGGFPTRNSEEPVINSADLCEV